MLAIKAHKEHIVSAIGILGTYLYTENNKYIIVLLRGILAGLMSMTNPKLYLKKVITD